jgi:acyl carrier protein
MSIDEVKSTILHIIGQVAPEIPAESIDPHARLQEEMDIDSMDFLRILVAINEQLGVEIPEKDYGQVGTLESLVHYVEKRV